MPDDHRVTIRLSPELYAQLEARGSRGQPLAAIIRDALTDYLARQPLQPVDAEATATTLADMAASIAELRVQVQDLTARLDALAAIGQPPAASEHAPPTERQPVADMAVDIGARPPVAAVAAASAPTAQQHRPRPQRPHGLPPETLARIAEERTHCEGLSLREFAQRLHTKGIHSSTAKDGSQGPVNQGTLAKWLKQAREEGLL